MMSVNLEKTLEHLTIMKAYGMKISLSIIYIRGHSIITFLKMRTKANGGRGGRAGGRFLPSRMFAKKIFFY